MHPIISKIWVFLAALSFSMVYPISSPLAQVGFGADELSLYGTDTQTVAPDKEPFEVRAEWNEDNGRSLLKVAFTIVEGYHLYGDMIYVKVKAPVELIPVDIPKGEMEIDKLSGTNELRETFSHDFTRVYEVKNGGSGFNVEVGFQGCSATVCFMPKDLTLTVGTPTEKTETSPTDEAPSSEATGGDSWKEMIGDFEQVGSRAGYLEVKPFLAFLSNPQGAGNAGAVSDLEVGDDASGQGWISKKIETLADQPGWIKVLVILIGGLLLNLTPCVLPMIPINLAIIGAGAQASSRGRGFLLGGAYGAGIALTYGALGIVAILGLAAFGELNSYAWFNFAIAGLFVFLALAMFDVIAIDFSRFQKTTAPGKSKGGFVLPFSIGCVSALLAGACVAPVVIAVLLFSADLHDKGDTTALFWPFLLGVGMALPWPFAGAGMSVLPKPGVWMNRIKYAFGVFILVFAAYYGYLGYTLTGSVQGHVEEGWLTSLPEALAESRDSGKPVFIDFWATWCKNCLAMDKTTFQDAGVQKAFEDYVLLKFQAEKPGAPEIKAVLDEFGVLGLPTYVVLHPREAPEAE